MPKLTIDDLERIRKEKEATRNLRTGESKLKAKITVHMGTCGITAGARQVMSAVMNAISENNLKDVAVMASGCAGLCSQEPMMTVELAGSPPIKYIKLDAEKTKRIVLEHVIKGHVVIEYALAKGSERMG